MDLRSLFLLQNTSYLAQITFTQFITNTIMVFDISQHFITFFEHFRSAPLISTCNVLSIKISLSQNTKPTFSKHFFSFCFPERTLLCGHFAPKIIKIGSRSSENETIEVSKYCQFWILLVLLFRHSDNNETTKHAISMHDGILKLQSLRSPSSVNHF